MTILPLPPGDYTTPLYVQVSMLDFERKKSKITDKPYIEVTWRIESCGKVPELTGHKVWDFISLSENAIWKLVEYEELVWKQILRGKRIFNGILRCEIYDGQVRWRFQNVPRIPNRGATLAEEPFTL